MSTIAVILSIWVVCSLPLSMVLGALLRDGTPPELIGMDGNHAVYCDHDGSLRRVSLVDHAPA